MIRGIVLSCLVLLSSSVSADDLSVTVTERVLSARKELEGALRTKVEGRIFERTPGDYVFVPTKSSLPQVTINGDNDFGGLAVGPLLQLKGHLDATTGLLNVDDYSLADHAPAPLPATPANVTAAAKRIFAALDKAVQNVAMSGPERVPDKETIAGKETIRAEYRKALNSGASAAVITSIVQQWEASRSKIAETYPDGPEFKALYGFIDNYDPWRYDVIYRQAPAVVAIGEPGRTTARCSGVLIADNLVLTAAHCFGGDRPMPPQDLEIWFRHRRWPPNAEPEAIMRRKIDALITPTPEHLSDILANKFSDSLLDYAIVRFKAADGEDLKPANARPQCLRERLVYKDDPVYVMGYPNGLEEMVHDSARVYLPYAVYGPDALDQLRLDVDADLLGSAKRAESMAQFDQSYIQKNDESSGFPMWFYRDIRENGQPRMGIIADTFHGNSGGPVYDRERGQCVVGILVNGLADTGIRHTANWADHERVLPLMAIIADLRSHHPEVIPSITLEN